MNDQQQTNEAACGGSALTAELGNEPKRESQGFMYVAKRKCGRVSAMRWDDPGGEKEAAKSLAGWVRRGDTVERIEVFKGDPMPEWICQPGCSECTVPNLNSPTHPVG